MKQFILITFLFALTFTACSQNKPTSENDVEKSALADVKRVSKAEFNTFKMAHPEAILLDVRTPKEYENGTIGNALNINFFDSDFVSEINKLDKTKPVLLFCQSGGRSAKALQVLKENGFQTVLELKGGYSQY